MKTLLPLLLLALFLTACESTREPDNVTTEEGTEDAAQGGQQEYTLPPPDTTASDTTTAQAWPLAPDGPQEIAVTVRNSGYTPNRIELRAGVPARLTFTRTEDGGCTNKVKLPDFRVGETDLPLNQPVTVTFTPGESGTFKMVCSMDMAEGSILVRA